MLTTKPLSWFKANQNQPSKEFSDAELRSLGASLNASGDVTLLLIVDQPGRETCPACRSMVEKVGFFLIDSENVRQFRCLSHTTELLRLALEPLQTVIGEA